MQHNPHYPVYRDVPADIGAYRRVTREGLQLWALLPRNDLDWC